VKLTAHLYLVLKLMCSALSSLPLYAFVVRCLDTKATFIKNVNYVIENIVFTK
jgi:hypothetical protein